MNPEFWDQAARNLLKSECQKRGISSQQLSEKLAEAGVENISPEALNRRISRGKFSLSFFLQCLVVMEIKAINIEHIKLESAHQR